MRFIRQTLSGALIAGLTIGLVACGDDDDNSNNPPAAQTETITGVAATGKPFAGKIKVINASGVESSEVTIAADGSYTVTVPKGAPYLLKATSTEGQPQTLYSYAPKIVANIPVNITQLTTTALFDANTQLNLANLYTNWANQSLRPTEAAVLQSAKEVIANLKVVMQANGLTEAQVNSLNVFNHKFTPVTTDKFDNLLDDVFVGYDCATANATSCTASYTVNDSTFTWNYNIDTTGITISFDGTGLPSGSGQTCVATVSAVAVTAKVCFNNFPENAACSAQNAALVALAQAQAQAVGGGSVSFAPAAACPADALVKIDYPS